MARETTGSAPTLTSSSAAADRRRAEPPLRHGMLDFQRFMRIRVDRILLVSSPYDYFILAEDGQLSERVFGEFRNLDMHYAPGITTVATGAEALALAREQGRFNLVISALRLADMSGAELARRLAADRPGVPVVLLAFDNRELQDFVARSDLSAVERVFLWQGDARILLAIVKCVEDRRNVEHDTRSVGVQVILLIEDNVRYYSSFLPTIYGELLQHSQRLIVEGANLAEKITRMRARPKILLCETFEQASRAFSAHEADILGRERRIRSRGPERYAAGTPEEPPDRDHADRPEPS